MSKDIITHYRLKTVCSQHSEYSFNGFIDICNEFDNGWIILWQHHAVLVGKITNKSVDWMYDNNKTNKVYKLEDQSNIVRIRAFDKTKEVHLWQSSKGLCGRLRTDQDDAGTDEFVETKMKLRSVIANPLKKLPEFEIEKTIDANTKERILFLTTRNYIGYNSIGQAGYVDSRFVEIIKK